VKPITVLPVITGSFVGGYVISGGYRLFHYNGTCVKTHNLGCPHFSTTLIPNHYGKYVYLVIQQHTATGWHSVAAFRQRLGSTSKALFAIPYTSTSVIGHYYRIAMVFKADAHHGAVAWGYWHFRITR
jgi:hypothetical protein